MNNPCIETGIDRLHSLVEERREITLTQAAELLRVPRTVVEHWSEALDEAGMIVTDFSFNEKSLMSKKHHRQKKGLFEDVKRQIKLFGCKTECPEERALIAREREVQKQARLIEKKIKELRKYEAARDKVEALIKLAAKEHKSLHALKKEIESEKERNLALKKSFEQKKEEHKVALEALQRREAGLAERVELLRERERIIAERETEIATKQKQMEHTITRIIAAGTE